MSTLTLECCVCFEAPTRTAICTPCRHILCLDCANAIHERAPAMLCPTCRCAVTSYGEVLELRGVQRVVVAPAIACAACANVECTLPLADCRLLQARIGDDAQFDAAVARMHPLSLRWNVVVSRKRDANGDEVPSNTFASVIVHVKNREMLNKCIATFNDSYGEILSNECTRIADSLKCNLRLRITLTTLVMCAVREHGVQHCVIEDVMLVTSKRRTFVIETIDHLLTKDNLVVNGDRLTIAFH